MHPGFTVAAAQVIENIAVHFLAHEGLGYPDAVDAFRDVGVQVGLLVALDLPGPVLSLFDENHYGGEDRQAAEAQQRQPHVGQEHKGHDKEQVAQIGDGIDDTVGEQIA